MHLNEKQIKRFSTALVIAVLGIIVFLFIKPVLLPVVGGLILAYICMPLYSKILKRTSSESFSAALVIILIVLVILIPLWIIIPVIIQQVFDLFRSSQTLNLGSAIRSIFPTSSEQFVTQMTVTFNTLTSKTSSVILNNLVQYLMNIPFILLYLFITGFVCFFTIRDSESLKKFVQGISPLAKSKEKIIVQSFKDITNAIIYGLIVVGIVQGLLAGLGFLLFKIPNALLLTIVAIILSVIPMLGPSLIWIPLTIYLFIKGPTIVAMLFIIYNILVVSAAENILRTYIVSKRTNLSQAVILVGMIGGFFIFGVLGFIIGPLILAYFITFLRSYKDHNLYSLFSE